MNQIELHKKIDELIQAGATAASVIDIREVVNTNDDARRYFFARADEFWLDWLWSKGFLDVIKQKSEDPTRYSYRTPELDYLSRVAEKNSARVVDFMLDVSISPNTFNPEVIDRFLWISSKLPAAQLAREVGKIRGEQWIRLMGPFNRWGFEYKQMFDTLSAAKDYGSIITLAEVVLTIRPKEDVDKTRREQMSESPFYFNDVHRSEVFERLVEVDAANTEAALALVLKTLGAVVLLGSQKEDDIFPYGDMFSLYGVDFFTLTLEHERHLSHRDDVRDLAAAAKILVSKVIGVSRDKPDVVRRLYEAYIVPLPDSRTMWRFRLFVWCQCPEVFKKELRDAFFRIFESENHPRPIAGGAEYKCALKIGFGTLPDAEKREYVNRILDFLGGNKRFHLPGYDILSTIFGHLTLDEKARAKAIFGRDLNPNHIPQPTIVSGGFGIVEPRTPPASENEWEKPVPEIVKILKTEWTPEALQKMDKKQDFHRPINAEGVAGRLQNDIKERLQDYANNATLFFDRDGLDAHYTYSFLRGIQEAVKADYKKATGIDWSPLVSFGKAITESGKVKPFDHKTREREQFDTWLVGWTGVHMNLADVIQELLRDEGGKAIIDFSTHRNDIFTIISYLLLSPDPPPEDEKIETAKIKEKPPGEEYQVSDPFTIAINSVRGRTFQAFLQFVQQDSKKFPKEAPSKLSLDVREAYEGALRRENTGAIMFMFGHYVPFFYYRDKAWMVQRLSEVFVKESAKIDLYFAAWEGYLTASLYKELFDDLQGEYARAIAFDPNQYTKRKYHGDLDEALATHLALAYIHFADFNLDSTLYKLFWNTPNTKRHGAFISFIGRHVISRDRPEEWLKEHPEVSVDKLKFFWDWALTNCNDKIALQKFGSWMQAKYLQFDPAWLADHIDRTLKKTGGDIDWEFGFMESLPILAKAAPDKTLSALRCHLIDGSILKEARGYIRVDTDLLKVFKILYENLSTRAGTYALINGLLPIGNGQFWELKEVINSNP
ncbi:MAG: hypothetical protein AAB588_06860 [Patescibacteria group bacterium]